MDAQEMARQAFAGAVLHEGGHGFDSVPFAYQCLASVS